MARLPFLQVPPLAPHPGLSQVLQIQAGRAQLLRGVKASLCPGLS